MNKKRLKEYDILYMDLAIRIFEMSHATKNKIKRVKL